MLMFPLVVTGLPVIVNAAALSVIPTLVTVPTYWSLLNERRYFCLGQTECGKFSAG